MQMFLKPHQLYTGGTEHCQSELKQQQQQQDAAVCHSTFYKIRRLQQEI